MGQRLVFRKTPAPSDIIWEHREKKDHLKSHFMAGLALLFILFCSFVIIYEISSVEQEISNMFPAQDCDFTEEIYGDKIK